MKKGAVQPHKWYTLADLARLRVFGVRSLPSVRGLLYADRRERNLLKAVITGQGRAVRYRIKGENVAEFKKVWEAGNYRL